MRKTYKIETYLPLDALDNVRNALFKLGIGKIGNYENCMNWYEVHSCWKAMSGANPYLGNIGEMEFATEYKLEFRCEEDMIEKAIQVIKENHPYEEVGINVIEVLVY